MILLIHGWPGSVWEFYKLIPLLTDTNNEKKKVVEEEVVTGGFEVICPSIPGYGFSEAPHKPGLLIISMQISLFNCLILHYWNIRFALLPIVFYCIVLYCIVFKYLYSAPNSHRQTEALLVRLAPRKVVGKRREEAQTKESARRYVIYCVGLGHMFLLVGCGRGARPYVSIMRR